MTHSPVVLVYVDHCKHVHSPLPHDIWTYEVCAIPAKTPSTNLPSFSTLTPWKPNCRTSPGQTYVDMCIWIPRLLMVLSTIKSPRCPTWTTRRVWSPKIFILSGVDWCITTINFSLTRRRIPKAILPFFCPTKPPLSASTNACMASIQETHHAPHQIKFENDSQKFLIDSGVSVCSLLESLQGFHLLPPPFASRKEE